MDDSAAAGETGRPEEEEGCRAMRCDQQEVRPFNSQTAVA